MSRSRASAKAAGRNHEKVTADYLAKHVDDRIERRTLGGAKDRGDIAGLRVYGQRVVIECKNVTKMQLGTWAREAEQERINDGALAAMVSHKRHGEGAPGDQWVSMTLRDLVALITGLRPEE